MSRSGVLVLSSCLLLLVAATAAAGEAQSLLELESRGELTLHRMVERSEMVCSGIIDQMHSYWGKTDRRRAYTDVSLKVDDAIKGNPGRSVTFTIMGGQIGRTSVTTSNQPVFEVGDEVVMFLKYHQHGVAYPVGSLVPTGEWRGKRRLNRGTDLASALSDSFVCYLRRVAEGEIAEQKQYDTRDFVETNPSRVQLQSRAPSGKLLTTPSISSVTGYTADKVRLDYIDDQEDGKTLMDTVEVRGTGFGSGGHSTGEVTYELASGGSWTARAGYPSTFLFSWSDTLITLRFHQWAVSGDLTVKNDTTAGNQTSSAAYAYEVLYNTTKDDFWCDRDIHYEFAYCLNADSTVTRIMS